MDNKKLVTKKLFSQVYGLPGEVGPPVKKQKSKKVLLSISNWLAKPDRPFSKINLDTAAKDVLNLGHLSK